MILKVSEWLHPTKFLYHKINLSSYKLLQKYKIIFSFGLGLFR